MRFWVSFYCKEKDFRPLTCPPNKDILGWWSSGMRCDDEAKTLCILVEAKTPTEARQAIARDWPESKTAEWRFFEHRHDDWLPNDRFPLSDWSKERIESFRASHFGGEW